MLRVFIGYDPRQVVAYTVLQNSILRHATQPVSITPLILSTLPITRKGLTPFTFSRFLVPWLCDYQGMGLFLDADILALRDITELFDLAKEQDAEVSVVQNALRFEWSSMMVFDCAKCKVLTPEFVQANQDIMKMSWAAHIGSLPSEWNHLVGYDRARPSASLVHFTQGIPCWPETKDCEYSAEWQAELAVTNYASTWEALMGNSVHAAPVMARLQHKNVA